MPQQNLHALGWPGDFAPPETAPHPCAIAAFLEGPAAHANGDVYFSDILNNRILRRPPNTRVPEVFRTPSGRANGLLFDREGRLLACEGNEFGAREGNRRVTRTNLETGEIEVLADQYEGRRFNSPNDIAACSNGQIYFTDPCYDDRSTMELDHDSVYRIDPDGRLTRVLTQPEIQRPNGIALSPDESTLYLIDSCPVIGGNRKVWRFRRHADGSLSDQQVVFDFAPGRGGDGMAVDAAGTLFVCAGIGAPRGPHETDDVPRGVYVIHPNGQLAGRIPIAEDVITNCTFGGPDLRTLYVTAGRTLYEVRLNRPGWVIHRAAELA